MTKKKIVFSLILNFIIVILVGIGIVFVLDGKDEFMKTAALLYYTNLSNILAGLNALVLIFFQIKYLIKEQVKSQLFCKVHFVCVNMIALTFLVFAVLLAPTVPTWYLTQPSNIILHYIVPVLAIFNFLFFEKRIRFKKYDFLLSCIIPLFYLVFSYMLVGFGFSFTKESKFPYFFLDYEKYGWFSISENGIGVFYYIVVLIALVIGMSFSLLKLKKDNNKSNAVNS